MDSKPESSQYRWSRRFLTVITFLSLLLAIAFSLLAVAGDALDLDHSSRYIITAAAFSIITIIALIGLRRRKDEGSHATAIHELASELSQVANKSEIVINAIGDGVIAIDGKSVIQLINPAAQSIIGWDKNDAEGLDYHSILKMFDGQGAALSDDIEPVRQVLSLNQPVTRNDLMLATGSGKKINVSLMVSPAGKPGQGAIIVFRDITSEVSENKDRTEFISTASHEMRTPVAAIEGYIGLVLNPSTAQIDDNARTYLSKAQESVQHLGRLFQDLLDISKTEDGRLKTNPSVIELVGFMRETASMLAPRATEKGLEIVFEPDRAQLSQVVYTHVDADHLREVSSNLIENAIKYTPKGRITINVTGDDKYATFSISDTGIGIAREDVPHLFQKFYRIDNTDTREIGGTGLGLYLCRRLVENMDGRIWVESKQGAGSTFFVELDRVSQEEANRLSNQLVMPE